ncbi:hypothetical protein [Burkholderia vietnamiensis]|nr:hypothetical protein [Burkholderia vietnamiensis]
MRLTLEIVLVVMVVGVVAVPRVDEPRLAMVLLLLLQKQHGQHRRKPE